MRDGSSSSPDKVMNLGFAAPPVSLPAQRAVTGSVCRSWRWQQRCEQHWGEAGARNARAEQGRAALGTQEKFKS